MALNPYTLYHLYEKGILDYVPTDLAVGTPVAPMMPMSNPYLDMAQQGGLYQNHGIHNDSFQFSGVQSTYGVNSVPYNVQIGSLSQAGGINTFNGAGIGALSQNTTANQFGFNNTIGAYNQAGGMNTYRGIGIGGQSKAGGMNTFGGFADVRNNLTNGYYKTKSVIDRTPKLILGLATAAIGVLGLKAGFGKLFGKKAAKKTSFLSKLNPMNWKIFSKKK